MNEKKIPSMKQKQREGEKFSYVWLYTNCLCTIKLYYRDKVAPNKIIQLKQTKVLGFELVTSNLYSD